MTTTAKTIAPNHSLQPTVPSLRPVAAAELDVVGRPKWVGESRGCEMRNLVETLPMDEIAEFCRRWKIQEMAVFGSVLRADFDSESDIDVIVTFDDDAEWSLLDHIKMQQELQAVLQRDVDLVTRRAVEQSQNWIRREEILSTASVIFSGSGAAYETR